MRSVLDLLILLALSMPTLAGPALACGFGEAPSSCGTPEDSARVMLDRVVTAIQADRDKALREFSRGEASFRTADTYVFCIGPNGSMTAHPSPMLQGQDVHDLHDKTGNRFIATMMQTAKPGEITTIHYLFPRPSGTVATARYRPICAPTGPPMSTHKVRPLTPKTRPWPPPKNTCGPPRLC
jgi:hypothetical protein